ncbi:phospho-sugar mutase [Sporosarcina sp.]|uniref:phospho-sugar mutase n=1 Tax=Sporosarcina sp. TaxID=49982 RepID=UPI002612B75E|nr:phospho-sugar mutase [Sporosarcina sp.]
MQWKSNLDIWLTQLPEDDPLLSQLMQIQNENLLEEKFYKELEFGTGGMRGIMGPGTNRLNIYTVRKVALGLAKYILNTEIKVSQRSIVVGYDSRHQSKEFALEVAKTVGSFGVKAYLFKELSPTPVLSFAVRNLETSMGVMITASHNPSQYNGLKVFGEDGAQLTSKAADQVLDHIKNAGSDLVLDVADEKKLLHDGMLAYIGEEVTDAYIEALQNIQYQGNLATRDLPIVFTALHGTATIPIRKAFDSYSFTNVYHVPEQELPDPNFSTVQSPNPEAAAAFELAIQCAKKYHAELILATDPDADRLGVALRNEVGEYSLLTGNQIGVLILHYMLEQKLRHGELPRNGVVIKTIATTEMTRAIGAKFDIKIVDVLIGFKYIAEKILEFEQTDEYTFLFGFEESHGYLIEDFVRDKDAVQTALYLAEMAAMYKSQGTTIYQVLQEIYKEFGYYRETTTSVILEGKDGADQINNILEFFRNNPPEQIHLSTVVKIEDYVTKKEIDVVTGREIEMEMVLPTSNVLKYYLDDGSWIVIRPSGTEPKCKFYFAVKAENELIAIEKLKGLENFVLHYVQSNISTSVCYSEI